MKSWNFALILGLICCLLACQETPTEQGIMGVWVGTSEGKREKKAFPAIYQFKPDSTFQIIFPDTVIEGHWSLERNLLQLQDSNWHAYFRDGGKLNLKRSGNPPGNYRILRRPEKTGQLISSNTSKELLQKTLWTNIQKIPPNGFARQDLHYYQNDSLFVHRRYFYNQDTLDFQEIESFCYQLKSTPEQQFAFFSNNPNCSNPMGSRQIIQLNDDQLVFLRFYHDELHVSGDEELHYFFFLALDDSIQRQLPDSASIFAPCSDEAGKIDAFGKIIYESHGLLSQRIQKAFKPFPNSQSGKIQIALTVDCQGRPGRINLIQTDSKGEPIYFAAPIVKQLFDLTVSSPFRANPEVGLDSQRKLVFEIKEGELVGIK
jgi:hypothetical protein